MTEAGFTVPRTFESWVETAPVDTTTLDGQDLLLRLGDFTPDGQPRNTLLEAWADAVGFCLDGIDVEGALTLLCLSATTHAIYAERIAHGPTGPFAVNVRDLAWSGAPSRFRDVCLRVDGRFLMAMVVDQLDDDFRRGRISLRTGVNRRRQAAAKTPRN
jgi:hypothetical protein